MAKLILDDVTNLTNGSAVTTINENSRDIEDALENTLSRDGTSPNEMNANLDMNNFRILNLPDPVSDNEPMKYGFLSQALQDAVATITEPLLGPIGWSPEFGITYRESDGAEVLQLVAWVNSDSIEPAPTTDIGKYVGSGQLVDNIEDAVNLKGNTGLKGDTGNLDDEWFINSSDDDAGFVVVDEQWHTMLQVDTEGKFTVPNMEIEANSDSFEIRGTDDVVAVKVDDDGVQLGPFLLGGDAVGGHFSLQVGGGYELIGHDEGGTHFGGVVRINPDGTVTYKGMSSSGSGGSATGLNTSLPIGRRLALIEDTAPLPPLIILGLGQSNMHGYGNIGSEVGSTVVDQSGGGIFIYSDITGGNSGSMVTCSFSSPPLSTKSNGPYCLMPHFANRIRQRAWCEPNRPIWIGMCCQGGLTIKGFTESGGDLYGRTEAMVARMQALWEASGGTGTLEIAHMHWQQGEADDNLYSTSVAASTDSLYISHWDTLMGLLRAMPQWTTETTVTIGEIKREAGYIATDTSSLVHGTTARNKTFKILADGVRDPKVGLVSTEGLGRGSDVTVAAGANHYSGLSLQEIGYRVGDALVAMRLGVQPLPSTSQRAPTLVDVAASGTKYLGTDDLINGCIVQAGSGSTIRLPYMIPGQSPPIHISVRSGTATLLAPRNSSPYTTFTYGGSSVSSQSLSTGLYMALLDNTGWIVYTLS